MRPLAAASLLLAVFGAALPGGAARGAEVKEIAVTVDDLPLGGEDFGLDVVRSVNQKLPSTLEKEAIPAVGFVNEKKLYKRGEVDARIEALRAWLDAGLELGNHTFDHPDFNRVGLKAYEEALVRGETVTSLLLGERGKTLRYFRHTFLRTGRTLEEKAAFEAFLKDRGYVVAPVTIENDDWHFASAYARAKRRGSEEDMARVLQSYLSHYEAILDFYEGMSGALFDRQIRQVLLCHDNELNADHFDKVAALFRSRGYAFISLEEALKDPAYLHKDTYVGNWGKSWLQRFWVSEGRPPRFEEEPDTPDWLDTLP